MPLARLVAAVFVVCSSFALSQTAQDRPRSLASESDQPMQSLSSLGAVTPSPSEPWRIIPEQPQANFGIAPLSALSNDQARAKAMEEQAKIMLATAQADRQPRTFKFTTPDGKIVTFSVPPGESAGATCYSIRSYQVARDSEDSDATHAVGESTCLPSARYGVHTADQRVKLSNGEDLGKDVR
jgi:hypothetical protein